MTDCAREGDGRYDDDSTATFSNVLMMRPDQPPGPPVPEASTLMLFASGLSGLLLHLRRRVFKC